MPLEELLVLQSLTLQHQLWLRLSSALRSRGQMVLNELRLRGITCQPPLPTIAWLFAGCCCHTTSACCRHGRAISSSTRYAGMGAPMRVAHVGGNAVGAVSGRLEHW